MLVVANPEDFALVTALYRSSIDGRRFMYEAILSEDGNYNIPKKFTSRASQILEVYLKSLGVKMETIYDDKEYIMENEESNEINAFNINNATIFCTVNDMYYLKKIMKHYKRFLKETKCITVDPDEAWEYIMKHLDLDKKKIPENVEKLFKNNIEIFGK